MEFKKSEIYNFMQKEKIAIISTEKNLKKEIQSYGYGVKELSLSRDIEKNIYFIIRPEFNKINNLCNNNSIYNYYFNGYFYKLFPSTHSYSATLFDLFDKTNIKEILEKLLNISNITEIYEYRIPTWIEAIARKNKAGWRKIIL